MQRSLSEIRTRVNELRELLESGVSSITVDNTTTVIDLDEIRRQLHHLEKQLPEFRDRRPRSSRIRLDL